MAVTANNLSLRFYSVTTLGCSNLGAFAEFERAMIRRRQAEGIAKAKARGAYKGRPISIDRVRVKELAGQGLGPSAIAKEMGIGRASVYRVISEGE